MANTEKFLNSSGLSSLWAKIKSKFYTKTEVDALIPEDEVIVVNITYDNGDYVADKTQAEVATAYAAGKIVYALYGTPNKSAYFYDGLNGDGNAYFWTDGYFDEYGNYCVQYFYYTNTGNTYLLIHGENEISISNTLTKTNTASYTPTGDYNPATKKYVDDAVAAVPTTISGLTDTTISSASNGQVLTYDSTNSKWINAAIPNDTLYFNINTQSASKTYDEVYEAYNSGKSVYAVNGTSIYRLTNANTYGMGFENYNGSNLSRYTWDKATNTITYVSTPILDTSISSPNAGQVLIYNSTNSKWMNGSVAFDIANLTDTTISSPANGQVLTYDSTTSKWVNSTPSSGVTETRVNELIAAALAQYGDGDTASYGYADASEVNY